MARRLNAETLRPPARRKGQSVSVTHCMHALPPSQDGPQETVEQEQSASRRMKPSKEVRSGTSRKARPSSRVGRKPLDTLATGADPSSVEKTKAVMSPNAVLSSQPLSAEDLCRRDTHHKFVLDRLVFSCRVRSQLMSAKNRLSNQIDAMDRLRTGILKKGKTLTKREPTLDDIAVAEATKGHIEPYLKPMDRQMDGVSKEIALLAANLPVWPWVHTVRGFGALGLGLIIGSTGDLSHYATPAKLWKRMGLALVGNERQRRTTDVEKSLAMGYSPRRRSLMHNIGDSLIKQNGISGDGYYRGVYDARKVYTETAHPDWTKAHRHMDALRYMEKRLLRHLWQVWKRQATSTPQSVLYMPADLDAQAADHYVGGLTSSPAHG